MCLRAAELCNLEPIGWPPMINAANIFVTSGLHAKMEKEKNILRHRSSRSQRKTGWYGLDTDCENICLQHTKYLFQSPGQQW